MSISISLDKLYEHPHYILYWVVLKKGWALKEWAEEIKPMRFKQGTGNKPLCDAIEMIEKYGTKH